MIFEHILIDEWNPAVYMTAYLPEPQTIVRDSFDYSPSPVMRKAVLICPGGAYLGYNEQETEPAALQFLAAGFCVFVLRYSIGAGHSTLPTPIVELSKSIGKIRSNAERWQIDAEEIYTCGFSTGAHLTLLQAEVSHADWLYQMTRLPEDMVKPNGLILGYPIIDLNAFKEHLAEKLPDQLPLVEMIFSALFSNREASASDIVDWHYANLIFDSLPPVFLWTLKNDKLMPPNTLESLCNFFSKSKTTYESHCFEGGSHGSGLNFNSSLFERARFLELVTQWML